MRLVVLACISLFSLSSCSPEPKNLQVPNQGNVVQQDQWYDNTAALDRYGKMLILEGCKFHGALLVTTLIHELGHALVNTLLTGDPIDIHLGLISSHWRQKFHPGGFKLNILSHKLAVHSLLKAGGFAVFKTNRQFLPMWGRVGRIAAGPLIQFFSTTPVTASVFSDERSRMAFRALLRFDALSNLIPRMINKTTPNDGALLCECMGIPLPSKRASQLAKGILFLCYSPEMVRGARHLLWDQWKSFSNESLSKSQNTLGVIT